MCRLNVECFDHTAYMRTTARKHTRAYDNTSYNFTFIRLSRCSSLRYDYTNIAAVTITPALSNSLSDPQLTAQRAHTTCIHTNKSSTVQEAQPDAWGRTRPHNTRWRDRAHLSCEKSMGRPHTHATTQRTARKRRHRTPQSITNTNTGSRARTRIGSSASTTTIVNRNSHYHDHTYTVHSLMGSELTIVNLQNHVRDYSRSRSVYSQFQITVLHKAHSLHTDNGLDQRSNHCLFHGQRTDGLTQPHLRQARR